MAALIPSHDHGTFSIIPNETIATFPIGTFLENIAIRSNGTLLISDMTGGKIYCIEPNSPDPQSTVREIHNFNTQDPAPTEGGESVYGSGKVATAVVEDSITPDIFYILSGQHGKAGTWAVYRLDLRAFDPASNTPNMPIEKFVDIPNALWLNGATIIPNSHTLLIAESIQAQIISVHIPTAAVDVWLQHELLGKITDRPPWPAANGIRYFRGNIFVTSSDRAILLRAEVGKRGEFVDGSLKIVADKLTGDDLAFDAMGNAFIATNPAQTVVKLIGLGLGEDGGRVTVLGGPEAAETAGPTAVAFGRGSKVEGETLYVVTTGGLVSAVNGKLELARVVRMNVL